MASTETKAKKEPSQPTVQEEQPKVKEKKPLDENSILFNLLPYLLGFLAVFVAFCIAFPKQSGLFSYITESLRFLFSYAVWAVPVFMLYGAFKLKDDMRRSRVTQKFVFSIVTTVFISVLIGLIFILNTAESEIVDPVSLASSYWGAYAGGGFIGDLLGIGLYKITGKASIFIASFLVLIFTMFEFGLTPEDIFVYIRDKIRARCHDIKNRQRAPKKESLSTEQNKAPADNEEPVQKRSHAAYKINRDLAYHLTKKNIDNVIILNHHALRNTSSQKTKLQKLRHKGRAHGNLYYSINNRLR